ncbi:hypothetical protein CBR_g3387 [Chara braunii]|uniref:DUF659 domain-containing protein n=1 Tax=Chara braunii TaxID=69332 RepID=A0A388JQR0_CHABU|nr:hypothetical protein CBR_g3387 [Chara braunii]|eukprot:GBG60144.1 hypothetical protein CBR_g3387 [Chara braunii]
MASASTRRRGNPLPPFVPVLQHKQDELRRGHVVWEWVERGQEWGKVGGGNFLIRCRLCWKVFIGSKSRGVEHFRKQKTYCPHWTGEILYELHRAGVVLRDAILRRLASEYAERVGGVMAADDLRHYMEAEGGGEEEHTRPGTPSRVGGADASLTGGADGGDIGGGTINQADDLDADRQRGGRSRGGTQPAGFEDAPPRVPGGVGGVTGGIEAGGCSVSAAPASTSVVGRRQSTLDPYIGNKIQMDLNQLWSLVIDRGGVAFNWLRLAEMQQLWDCICTLFRPTIVPVPQLLSYEGVRTTMLDIIFHEVAALIAPNKAKWTTSGCTLMMDGASDTTNKPIINFIAAGDSKPILIRVIDMLHRDKTGVSLAEIWEDVIRHDIGNAICTDKTEVMKTTAHMLQTHPDPAMRRIPWIPCATQCLSLLLRDIAAQPIERQTMKDAHKIVKFMRNKQKALILHKVMKKAMVLKLLADTRFGTSYMMLERLYDQREVLDTLVSSERLCRDDDFWSGVRTVMDVMGHVYALLRDVDRDGSSPTDRWDLEAILRQRLCSLELSDFDKDAVMTIVRDQCEMMRQPAHAAAYLLDPLRRDISLLEDRRRPVVQSALEHFALVVGGWDTKAMDDLWEALWTFHSDDPRYWPTAAQHWWDSFATTDLLSASKRTDNRYMDIWADQVEEGEVALDEDDAIPADVPEEEAEAIERSTRRKEGGNRAGKGKALSVDSEDDIFYDLVWMHQGIRNEAEAQRGAGMILLEDQHDLLDEWGGHDPHDDFDAYVGGTMHTVVSMRKRVGGEVDMEELLARDMQTEEDEAMQDPTWMQEVPVSMSPTATDTSVADPSYVATATPTSQPHIEHGVDTHTQAEMERRVPQHP